MRGADKATWSIVATIHLPDSGQEVCNIVAECNVLNFRGLL